MKRTLLTAAGIVLLLVAAGGSQQRNQAPTPAAQKPLRVCRAGVAAPCAKYPPKNTLSEDPECTRAAIKDSARATVKLTIVVGVDGKVSDVHVVRHSLYDLDNEAARAVTHWRFTPGKLADGTAVPVQIEVVVDFAC